MSDARETAICSFQGKSFLKYSDARETGPCGPVVEHPLRGREVVGSNPGGATPKALKLVPVATLLGAQHYKTSTGFSSPYKYCTTNIATLTKTRGPMVL